MGLLEKKALALQRSKLFPLEVEPYCQGKQWHMDQVASCENLFIPHKFTTKRGSCCLSLAKKSTLSLLYILRKTNLTEPCFLLIQLSYSFDFCLCFRPMLDTWAKELLTLKDFILIQIIWWVVGISVFYFLPIIRQIIDLHPLVWSKFSCPKIYVFVMKT